MFINLIVGVTLTALGGTGPVRLNWTPSLSAVDGYNLWREVVEPDAACGSNPSSLIQLDWPIIHGLEYVDDAPVGTYCYHVAAKWSALSSAPSNVVKVTRIDVFTMEVRRIVDQVLSGMCMDDPNGDGKCDLLDVITVLLRAP